MRLRLAWTAAAALSAAPHVATGQPTVDVATLPTLSLRRIAHIEAASIGSGTLAAFAVSATGKVVFTDPADRQVHVLRPDGGLLWTRGARGTGPGEFERLGSARGGFIADTVWVYDDATRRVTLFGPSGSLLRSVMLPDVLAGGRIPNALSDSLRVLFFSPHALKEGGGIVGLASFGVVRVRSGAGASPEPASVIQRSAFVEYAGPGGRVRELYRVPEGVRSVQVRVGTSSLNWRVPFVQERLVALAPAGAWWATLDVVDMQSAQPTIQIHVHSAAKDGARVVRLVTRPKELAPADRERAIQQAAASASMAPASARRRALEELRAVTPKTYPLASDIKTGDDGTVAVKVIDAARGVVWVLVDADGRAVGVLQVHPNALVRAVSRSYVWVQVADRDGLVTVSKYAVSH